MHYITSSAQVYQPTPLALWLPNRWSRRLRVNDPDWKGLFEGGVTVDRATFDARLQTMKFKYPADCAVPQEACAALSLTSGQGELTGEALLKRDASIVASIEVSSGNAVRATSDG
jgi:hypothetical protein